MFGCEGEAEQGAFGWGDKGGVVNGQDDLVADRGQLSVLQAEDIVGAAQFQ